MRFRFPVSLAALAVAGGLPSLRRHPSFDYSAPSAHWPKRQSNEEREAALAKADAKRVRKANARRACGACQIIDA